MTHINVIQDIQKYIKSHLFKPEHDLKKKATVPHQMPKEKMEPALKLAVQNGEPNKATFIALSESSIIRGGLVGAILTAAIGFNAGKYSRLGAARKRWKFLRKFIAVNNKPHLIPFTRYFYPNIKTVTKNIFCFSGQQGVGKSYHFQRMAYIQSLVRPSLYISFKATGKGTTFQQDLANKLNYGGGENPPMLSQILYAVRKINFINTHPYLLWSQIIATHLGFAWSAYEIIESDLLEANQGLFLGMLGTAYSYYFYILYPWIVQSFRRTKPLLIFDDINKIENLGMLAQISRFLQLHEQNMGNVILIASDEETWFKLRKQPGLKDRLRQRVLTYDHQFTANQMLQYIKDNKNYLKFLQAFRISPLYTKQLIELLIKQLVGIKQVTIRRLRSILLLNDQQQYERYVKVLVACREGEITVEQAAKQITQILHESQMLTICAKLKHIKRQIKIPEEQYIQQMRFLLQKGKLPSDNKIAPFLMSYSILRDNQSEYVFNGKFMFNVFQMAYQQYIDDLKHFYGDNPSLFGEKQKFDSNVASRSQQQKPHNKINSQTEQSLEKAKKYDNTK